jgi:hypothetical protein
VWLGSEAMYIGCYIYVWLVLQATCISCVRLLLFAAAATDTAHNTKRRTVSHSDDSQERKHTNQQAYEASHEVVIVIREYIRMSLYC